MQTKETSTQELFPQNAVEEPFAGARSSTVGPLASASISAFEDKDKDKDKETGLIEGDGVELDVIHWDTDRVREYVNM